MPEWLASVFNVLKIYELFKKLFLSRKKETVAIVDPVSPEQVADRFLRLFEEHGVAKSQIPKFFDHGLKLSDFKTADSLIDVLNDEMLDDAAALFNVNRGWLDGVDDNVYTCLNFYKNPRGFSSWLDSLLKNTDSQLRGIVVSPSDKPKTTEAVLLIEETIAVINDRDICRYYVCDNWVFSYWKARAYLCTCVAYACKKRVYLYGIRIPSQQIREIFSGNDLLGWKGEGLWFLGNKSWDPEDMVLAPEIYLEGINPELDNYGTKSALAYWIELAEKGFMDTDIKRPPLEEFKTALEKANRAPSKRCMLVRLFSKKC